LVSIFPVKKGLNDSPVVAWVLEGCGVGLNPNARGDIIPDVGNDVVVVGLAKVENGWPLPAGKVYGDSEGRGYCCGNAGGVDDRGGEPRDGEMAGRKGDCGKPLNGEGVW